MEKKHQCEDCKREAGMVIINFMDKNPCMDCFKKTLPRGYNPQKEFSKSVNNLKKRGK